MNKRFPPKRKKNEVKRLGPKIEWPNLGRASQVVAVFGLVVTLKREEERRSTELTERVATRRVSRG